jgi:hypothetical protein
LFYALVFDEVPRSSDFGGEERQPGARLRVILVFQVQLDFLLVALFQVDGRVVLLKRVYQGILGVFRVEKCVRINILEQLDFAVFEIKVVDFCGIAQVNTRRVVLDVANI